MPKTDSAARQQNALIEHYGFLDETLRHVSEQAEDSSAFFAPAFRIPEMSSRLADFFSPAEAGVSRLGRYRGKDIALLNLMGNPRTRTTKTFASLVLVARAVEHIRTTGEPITIVTPSSANKGTALRDAVLRAIESGLADPDQLQITTLVPETSRDKIWSSPLDEDVLLRRRNPIAVLQGGAPADVKTIAQEFVAQFSKEFLASTGRRLWYTLGLDNYRVADAVRARVESTLHPAVGKRIHVHSVSSAYGLLGHHFGRTRSSDTTGSPAGHDAPAPAYFLVQHLGRPDMVVSLYHGDFSRSHLPDYRFDADSGLYRQDTDPHFPQVTADPQESLDSTFYTSCPPTSPEMNALIAEQGGGGIVVSRKECLDRYFEIRHLLSQAGIALPDNPGRLREWSLVMAMTGTLLAIDRGLMPQIDDVLVHGSGSYTQDDFEPLASGMLHKIGGLEGFRAAVLHSAQG